MANFVTKSVLITGANRGLGLELVQQLVSLPQPPKHVFATCRQPQTAKELKTLAAKHQSIHIHQLDVANVESFPKVVAWVENLLEGEGLNVLINNGGVAIKVSTMDEITPDMFRQSFDVNAIGPFMLSKAFLPLLKRAAVTSKLNGLGIGKAAIINMSTKMACIADNGSGGHYMYRSSKTALNMITKSLSVDLKSHGILAVVLHPGWVLTDMGGSNALINTETSIQGLLAVMANLSEKDTGSFFDYKGDMLPW